MVTQPEIDAAVEAYLLVGIGENVPAAMLAILEAAERARPKRKDSTVTERSRRFRAKRNGVAGGNGVAGDSGNGVAQNGVASAGGNGVAGNAVAGERNAVAGEAMLLTRLRVAAGGNVHPAATDTGPIAALLEQGCELELDVLPAVHDLLTDPLQPPIKRWDRSWLTAEITRRRDERTGHVTAAPARDAPVRQPAAERAAPPRRSGPPAAPSFDMDELVARYRAGNVDWDVGRFGPPPGSPGCRVDAGILRANGYR